MIYLAVIVSLVIGFVIGVSLEYVAIQALLAKQGYQLEQDKKTKVVSLKKVTNSE
jgi:hypothetical protein